ncbi:MAG: shikimate kinase [Planctomycetaceae bacterium]
MTSRGLLLIGPRGAGKSTTGPLVAGTLRLPFLDADDELERETGRTVSELLAQGELRPAEARLLRGLLAGPPCVLAAGGGCVLWEGLGDAAEGWGVAWLDAPAEVLARRIAGDARVRPSLTGKPPDEEIGRVAEERRRLYAAVASSRFDTSSATPAEVAASIARWWMQAGRSRS